MIGIRSRTLKYQGKSSCAEKAFPDLLTRKKVGSKKVWQLLGESKDSPADRNKLEEQESFANEQIFRD